LSNTGFSGIVRRSFITKCVIKTDPKIMFAYVKFTGLGSSSCKRIVPIENIKKFDAKKIQRDKLYKVKNPGTGEYLDAQLIFVEGNV